MHIVLFGPYGSGKGTQGRILAEKHNLQSFDTGEQIRFHIKNQTEIGKQVKAIVDRGDLVPNEVVMVEHFIEQADATQGLLFDGIPRFEEQAKTFDALLEKHSISPIRILVNISSELSLDRQLKRNAKATEKRADSTDEIAKKRVSVYETETLPMIAVYMLAGAIHDINGDQPIEQVTADIEKILK
jgi:adenylate kinase